MPANAFHVITLAEAIPAHIEEIHTQLREMANLHRQEEGCLRFDVYADINNPALLNTIEVWTDEAAYRRHLDSPLLAHSVMQLIGKVSGLPQIRVLGAISEFGE